MFLNRVASCFLTPLVVFLSASETTLVSFCAIFLRPAAEGLRSAARSAVLLKVPVVLLIAEEDGDTFLLFEAAIALLRSIRHVFYCVYYDDEPVDATTTY